MDASAESWLKSSEESVQIVDKQIKKCYLRHTVKTDTFYQTGEGIWEYVGLNSGLIGTSVWSIYTKFVRRLRQKMSASSENTAENKK